LSGMWARRMATLVRGNAALVGELGEVPEGFFTDPEVRKAKWQSLSHESKEAVASMGLSVCYGVLSADAPEPEAEQEWRVQGYSFSLAVPLVLGEPQKFEERGFIMRAIRVRALVTNAPLERFVELEDVSVDSQSLKPFYNADGPDYHPKRDAWMFSPGNASAPEGHELGNLLCDHGACVRGSYSGAVPSGYAPGFPFLFLVTLQGPAELVRA
jgi:hypothetical protein